MSDIKAQLEGLRHDWSVCKAQDDQKHSLITSLFNHVDSQSDLLLDANAELRDKKDAIKVTRERVEELEEQLRELQLEKDRHAFVLVIIDGDCMPFRDDLVRDGLEGGKRTASILKQAVEGELKSFDPVMSHHLQVIVRVYANLKGLAKTYKDTSILPAPDSLEAFVSGFNMGDTLCDYVDAGNGKECADEKVKASFQHHLADVHCRQIFFGASADSAYARLLGKYLQDEVVRRRICLIEGPPWAQELADLKDKFHTGFVLYYASNLSFGQLRKRCFQSPVYTSTSPSSTPSLSITQRVGVCRDLAKQPGSTGGLTTHLFESRFQRSEESQALQLFPSTRDMPLSRDAWKLPA
ncbi:hypothetical protein QSH57_004150 [Fusarium oxysporum f. sp. vasinfectum]|nr:hypothetical protein QSH57_004150 [Fusarium oxysporum f. sp. vasinfectum]